MMESAYIIGASIGGMVALIVVVINQIMEHLRWKENLLRKGEEKYLDKRIEILHESNVELFHLANEALKLSSIPKQKGLHKTQGEFRNLDNKVRQSIAISSPYLENEFKDRIENLYEILTNIRLILNNEAEGSVDEVTTNFLWLNEEIWFFRDELIEKMKGFKKNYGKDKLIYIFLSLSLILNAVLSYFIMQ